MKIKPPELVTATPADIEAAEKKLKRKLKPGDEVKTGQLHIRVSPEQARKKAEEERKERQRLRVMRKQHPTPKKDPKRAAGRARAKRTEARNRAKKGKA